MAKKDNMNVSATADFHRFEQALKGVPTDVNRQFAIGLSRIARAGKEAAQAAFTDNYIERNKFMTRSIIYTGATRDRLTAKVGTINHLMGLHLFGGTKSGNVAVKGVRGDDRKGRVTRGTTVAFLEGKMAVEGKSHKFFTKTVNGRSYIFAKVGGTHKRMRKRAGYTGVVYDRTPIVPMWLLREGKPIKIKADWQLVKVVEKTMQDKAPGILLAVIEDAWNHAREKGRV